MKKPTNKTFENDIEKRIHRSEDEGLDELIESYEKRGREGLLVLCALLGAAVYAVLHHFIVH
jgi:hypothetical protein